MGLAHAVITCVARDDLDDGGAGGFAATIAAIRRRRPGTAIEVLISDCKGDAASLRTVFDARPDVLNHNIETVARLQRAVRPSAGYARSLAVLARAKDAGLTTKSGIILGHGRDAIDEVLATLADLRGVGVDIVTVGQYLRPSRQPPAGGPVVEPRGVRAGPAGAGMAMGFAHVAGVAPHPVELPRPPGGRGVGAGRPTRRRSPATAAAGRHQRPSPAVTRARPTSPGRPRRRHRPGPGPHGRARASTPCCCPTGPTCPG